MGRTNPTVRDRLDRLEREWQPFRRALRRRHRDDFDRLFERARGHADAASHHNPETAWRAFVMAVLLAQERDLQALRAAVDDETAGGDDGSAVGAGPDAGAAGGEAGADADQGADGDR